MRLLRPRTISLLICLELACLSFAQFSPLGHLIQLEGRTQTPAGFSLNGVAPSNATLNLRIALKSRNATGLEDVLMQVSTPGHPKYGQHLSKAEVEAYITPSDSTVQAVTSWLASEGVSYSKITPAGDWIATPMSVDKASRLFGAEFSLYTHEDTGLCTIRTLAYSIPALLHEHIDLVHPMIAFPNPRSSNMVIEADSETILFRSSLIEIEGKRDAQNTVLTVPASCASAITPSCLQALYGIPTQPSNSTVNKLGVPGYTNYYANHEDLKTFLNEYRPDMNDSTSFATVLVNNGTNPQNTSLAGYESDLDIEYTVGLATGVPVTFISVGGFPAPGTDLDIFLYAADYLVNMTEPFQVLSSSYGESEDTQSLAFAQKLCSTYAQLGARGTSIVYGSGDGGVCGTLPANCSNSPFFPTFPSDCPYVTSVGATTGISPEVAANYSSGGFSNYFSAPSYQQTAVSAYIATLIGNSTYNATYYEGRYNASGRAFPDVAAQGSNYNVINQGRHVSINGTSCATPTFSSMISLLNSELISAGKSPLGFLNPWLYANPSMFTDITIGTNPGCCLSNGPGFPAAKGWDPITGLGTPNYAKMREAAGLS